MNYNSASALLDPSIPSGTYVAFEDLPLYAPPDWNYFDDTFVFTNTRLTVPEPSTFVAGALLLLPFGARAGRMLRNRKA